MLDYSYFINKTTETNYINLINVNTNANTSDLALRLLNHLSLICSIFRQYNTQHFPPDIIKKFYHKISKRQQ